MIITTNTPMQVVTKAISKQGTQDASCGARSVRKTGGNMKRGSLRRSQSLQVGTTKTQKLDAVAVAKKSAGIEEDRPETSYKPTKLGWRKDGRPSNGRPVSIDAAGDGAELSQGKGDVFDMPPQPPKLGEAFRVRRPSTSSRARTYSVGPFEDSSSRSHHGSAISQDQRVRGTAEGRINASPPSPDGGVHDAPVQFQRMPKPPGWQEEQAVEIRRDWITYLAKGMGIDTEVHTGHELETLVVRRMLEQAEEDLLADSFDEWDTDDDEEDGRQYSEKHPKQRRIPSGTRRSRSHSRSRQNTSTFSRLIGDNRLTSPPLSGRGDEGGDRPGSGKRPRGGALRRVLRRSQTTGDMDAPDKPRRRSSATQQAVDNLEERGGNRRDRSSSRRRGGGLPDGRLRGASNESRSSSRKSGTSTVVTMESEKHSRKSSGGSSALSVSSRGSSRSREGSDLGAKNLDEWRDNLSPPQDAAGEDGPRAGGAGVERNGAEIYRRDGTDGNICNERSGRRSRSRSQSRGRDGGDVGGGAGIGAPSPRRSQNEKGAFTLTELLLQDDKRASSSANAPSRRNDDGDRMDRKGGSRERGRNRGESRGRSSRDGRSRAKKNADTVTESRSTRKSRSRGAEERAQGGDKGRSSQDVRSTRKDRPSVERRGHASGSKRSSSRDARVSSVASTRSNTGGSPDNSKAGERRVVTKTRQALSQKARMMDTLAAAVAGANAGGSDACAIKLEPGGKTIVVTTVNETATRPARAKRSSDTTKEARSDAGDGDAAGGGGADSRPPLGQHSNPAARSASGTTELRTRSRGERGLSAGAESRSGGVMDASLRRGEGERRARRASADTKRQRLPIAAGSAATPAGPNKDISEQRFAVGDLAGGVRGRARADNDDRLKSSSSRSRSRRSSSRRAVSPKANSDDDDSEEDGAALARVAAKLLTNAVVTGAAAHELEGTMDDPLNPTDDLMNGVDPVEKMEGHDTAESDRIDPGDPQRFLKLRPYVAQASGAQSRPRRPLGAGDSAALKAEAEVAETSVTTVAHPARTTRHQQYGSAVPPSSAPTPVSAPAPRGHNGPGERTATRQRSGGSNAQDSEAIDREAEPRRGRSRERRGGGAAGGVARSGARTSGSGSRQGLDRPRGVVQSTGAAAAAEAAADDGRYGKDWDKLEMHRAVYASDTPRLRFFMDARPEGLKQVDHHGNTPLLLALKLARTEMAWMMIRAGAELDIPSDGSFHLLDEAIVLGDEDLLVEVYGRLQRQSWGRWRAKVPDLLGLLEDSIPDFYMEMHWSFECSNVLAPLVKAVAPHDHYRIWKRGSWLRMDSTITGYTKRLKTQRGNVSVLFLGNDSPGPGTLIKLDHGKKKIYNVLRRLESPTSSEVRRTCKRYLVSGQQKRSAQQNTALKVDAFVIKSSELDFKPVLDQGGQLKKGTVGPWTCDRYECTGDMQLQTFRKGPGDNLLAGLSMKAYFDASKTLEDKVLNATLTEGAGAVGSASPGPGAFFNFGERAKEHQKAKSLAKLNTPHKRFDKKIKASMWMSQEFPLTLEHVTPMLEILSMQDKVIHKLKEVLTTKGMREAGFPAKVSLPLYLGVCAAVTFDNCRVFERGELEPELFLVNPSYSSSRRMRKGVFEGVMPGNILVDASSFSNKNLSGGEGAGGGTRLPPVPIAGTVSSTPHRASSLGRSVSSSTTAGRKSQQPFNIRQPSFGPGSPEAPIADIARAAKVKSAPLERVSPSAEAAIGGLSFEFGRKAGCRTSTNLGEGEILRGRKDAMTDGEIAGSCTEDISRGNRAWTGDDLGGKGGGGEWQGGDSDEDSSDEEDDDDLVLHR